MGQQSCDNLKIFLPAGSTQPIHYYQAPCQTYIDQRLLDETRYLGWHCDYEPPEYGEIEIVAKQRRQLNAEIYEIVYMKGHERG